MKNKKLWLFALAAALSVVLAVLWLRQGSAPADARHKVVLVAKSTGTAFWKSVFAGARTAGSEYNLELTILGPDTEEDYQTQNEMVARAAANGAEAVVFSAIDYEKNVPAVEDAAAAGVKIISIDSGVNSRSVSAYIGTDNLAAGRMAGRAALTRSGELRVGLVNFDASTANGQERERGVREVLAGETRVAGAATVYTDSEADTARADTLALLAEDPALNVLIAFNEPTTVGAARAVKELGLEDRVWLVGFDSNIEAVDMLQTGAVDALVVQNPYAIGYLGVESAWKLLTGQLAAPAEDQWTASTLVTRENMFSTACQRLLFPFAGEPEQPET